MYQTRSWAASETSLIYLPYNTFLDGASVERADYSSDFSFKDQLSDRLYKLDQRLLTNFERPRLIRFLSVSDITVKMTNF